jgi:hypothetical protein
MKNMILAIVFSAASILLLCGFAFTGNLSANEGTAMKAYTTRYQAISEYQRLLHDSLNDSSR